MKMYFNASHFFDDILIESRNLTRELAIDNIKDYYMDNYAFTLEVDGESVRKIDLMDEVRAEYPLSAWEIEANRYDDMRKEC